MKKHLLLFALLIAGLSSFGQSEKYIKAMEKLVPAIDTTRNPAALNDLANSFQRIADAEKNQWLPYYYAALANVSSAYMSMGEGQTASADKIDPVAEKAEGLLQKAEALSANNSEIFCLKKMIGTLKLMADPMNRYMTYGPAAAEALATAKKLNPENPRVYLLEGQDKFYTPEQFGGSKEEAKKLFQAAMAKYDSYKPESSIHPSWGKGQAAYFINLAQ